MASIRPTALGKKEKGFPPLGKPRQRGAPLIPHLERGLLLRMPQIDGLHQEFADMVNALERAKGDEFSRIFQELVSHTEAHFAYENNLMQETNFPQTDEHQGEHGRVLEEMTELGKRVRQGEIEPARTFVCERLPKWFRFHVITMDNALAAHVQK
jgi:hemerythrin-like metal-binding protein